MKNIGLFPGQGSQKVGMGHDLFETQESTKELFIRADKVLGFELSKLCFSGPEEELTLTKNAQPAILVSSMGAYSALQPTLAAAAGHSLGEYSALVAAGSINFEDAVQLVHKRGSYMQEAVEPGAGAMVAVMGPTESEISQIIESLEQGICEIANLNCPGQTVVAGEKNAVAQFTDSMSKNGGKCIPLKVSAPFHCSLMEPAAEQLSKDLDALTISEPSFPVFSNVTAKPQVSANEIRNNLKQQVCSSVRWTESMQNIISQYKPDRAIEFGQGAVLSKLLKRIDKSVPGTCVYDSGSLSID